jgi:type VI secretion system protein ImpC
MAANLVALFSVCRVAHFLKAIGRDVLQHLGDTRAAEDWLRSWIANYVDRPQVPPGGMTDDARPFASADVEVRASDDDPTLFTTRYTLRPAAWVMGRDAALPRDPPR